MQVNIKQIGVSANGSDDNHKFIRLSLLTDEMANETYKTYDGRIVPLYSSPVGVVISLAEAKHAIACANGESDFCPYYDDGIYLIKVTCKGIRFIHNASSQRHSIYYASLPGEIIANILQKAVDWHNNNSEKDGRLEWFASDEHIAAWRVKYGPSVYRKYHDYQFDYQDGRFVKGEWQSGCYNKVIDLKDKMESDLKDNRVSGLQTCIDSIDSIAFNNSDGLPVTINYSFDEKPVNGVPSSYYWCIEDHNHKTIMNGGLIAHQDYKDNESDKARWHYTIHT